MLMMCTIVSVPVTFWAAIMWGGWPFTIVIKNQIAAGLVMLVAFYLVNYALFRVFFDYGFMQGAPVYVPSLDPHGTVQRLEGARLLRHGAGRHVLHPQFRPVADDNAPAVMKQPMLGLVWTLLALVLGGDRVLRRRESMGMDPIAFLVRVPVPFIFGIDRRPEHAPGIAVREVDAAGQGTS